MHEFRVWAPLAKRMRVQYDNSVCPMMGPDDEGWWGLQIERAEAGFDYAYLIDNDETPYPDPRSPWQPNGVHGASRLYSQTAFPWSDQRWLGPPLTGGIFYELHIGTFSDAGTFDGAIEHLQHLEELGVTHVEIMPVAEWAGAYGWGYDGVSLFAVSEAYGGPDGLKRFVDAAHTRGIAVILDVVYNHFGPVGNYTTKFGPYLNDKHKTPWGESMNFDEEGSDQVRRFFCDNAIMWLRDYHIDGLRLDATHEFHDRAAVRFIEQLSAEVEQLSAVLGRKLVLIAENDLNDPTYVRPREAGGYGMDAQWSDDFHHALFTVIYDKEKGMGYYDDFGSIEQLSKALTHAFVYTGDYSRYRKRTHGRPIGNLSAHHFVGFIQNHDQIGNRAQGERIEHLAGLDAAKVGLALTLSSGFLPMMFMGDEFAASSPFLYFADHEDEEMRKQVAEGRKREFAKFFGDMEVPNPEDPETFRRSKLNWSEITEGIHADMLRFTKAMIKLRRTTLDMNDGDLGHVTTVCDEKTRTLALRRRSMRALVNFGKEDAEFALVGREQFKLATRDDVKPIDGKLVLPPMTLALVVAEAPPIV